MTKFNFFYLSYTVRKVTVYLLKHHGEFNCNIENIYSEIRINCCISRIFFEGLYSQKIKTLKTSKLTKRKIKSLMEKEIPSGTT